MEAANSSENVINHLQNCSAEAEEPQRKHHIWDDY
jgi:hypothetical protein